MLESLRPFTWLVGAVATWSLGLLLLGFAGLGGRVGPHPGDPTLAPAIPELRFSENAQRLGPQTDYLAVGERPLFLPDRRPAPIAIANAEQQAPFEGVLTSVLLTESLKMAIFSENNGQVSKRVRLGETIPGTGWRLAVLEPRRAVLEGPGGQRALDLRRFDGQGGQAPTPMTVITEAKPATNATTGNAASSAAPGNPPSLLQQGAQANAEAQRSAEEQAQIDAIRARIEARRAQLREQQEKNANAPITEQ